MIREFTTELICDGYPNSHICDNKSTIYIIYEIFGTAQDLNKYCSNCYNHRLRQLLDVFGYTKGYQLQKVITKERYLNLISLQLIL